MAAPRPKSPDLGAAFAGLVLGGSVMFLIILTIVWLTNSHFAAEKAVEKQQHATPVATAPAPAVPAATPQSPPPATR
ncbi:MAG: hypothetical protein Q7S20_06565 [Gemmatimonadaceae bacterium]|nr:hypothetical protein [Gemmatimonadaceae bacterium]